MKRDIRVIIAGSRNFCDYKLLKEKCDYFLSNKLKDPCLNVIIVSGHARGADSLGEKYAAERNLGCEIYPANWDQFGKRAGYIRNTVMANAGDFLIAFMDAYSENKGTRNMIDIATSKNLPIRIVQDEE